MLAGTGARCEAAQHEPLLGGHASDVGQHSLRVAVGGARAGCEAAQPERGRRTPCQPSRSHHIGDIPATRLLCNGYLLQPSCNCCFLRSGAPRRQRLMYPAARRGPQLVRSFPAARPAGLPPFLCFMPRTQAEAVADLRAEVARLKSQIRELVPTAPIVSGADYHWWRHKRQRRGCPGTESR